MIKSPLFVTVIVQFTSVLLVCSQLKFVYVAVLLELTEMFDASTEVSLIA
jgi:hypothetical protein